ncbi:hypothetical protein Bbelb_063650, partial [Branchiostoma belcheri]
EDHYEPFLLGNLESTILERQDHQDCPSRTLKTFKVFNSSGRVCYWRIFVCDHEADACTLLRFGLWAATADRPETAFSTDLLEWLTALTLECQVSVKGFCNAVRWRSGLSKYEVDILYRALIGQSVAEFHHHLYKKRTLLHLCAELDDGTDEGEMIVSLDANFGLVRKRSSGRSSAGPLHQSRYFLPEDDVKEFMSTYSEDSKPDEDCNNFQAGSSVRSRSRQEKLDVTGVFGAVCRHSVPLKFLDMHHGESPRRKEGFGLSDGEVVERLWSYLRKFKPISKEMTPSHRSDLLTDALLHYSRRKAEDMHVSLAMSYDKAVTTYQLAKDDLAKILNQVPVAVSEEDVEMWRQSELDLISQSSRSRQSSSVTPWKKTYTLELSAFYSVRLEQKLECTERKHKVHRWEEHHDEYKSTLRLIDQEERKSLVDKLWREAAERTFLLSLKKKYPDGQAIATKLGRQLKTVNNKLKKTISKYNSIGRSPQDSVFPEAINFVDACQPTWQCYTQLDLLEAGAVPRSVKRQAIEALCLKKSAEEELWMTCQDMRRLLGTGKRELGVIDEALEAHRATDNVGAVAMLLRKRDTIESRLDYAHKLLETKNPDLPELHCVPARGNAESDVSTEYEYLIDSESDGEDDDGQV